MNLQLHLVASSNSCVNIMLQLQGTVSKINWKFNQVAGETFAALCIILISIMVRDATSDSSN